MARRTKFVDAALRAVIEGQSKFHFFGKERLVDDWLTPDQKNNAQAVLSKRLNNKQALETAKPIPPKPADEPLHSVLSEKYNKFGETHINKSTRWDPERDPCFIIANGESRKGFDLTKLNDKGYIIGMNVLPLIENFWPNALISVDIATVKHICEKNVPDKTEMWSYPRGGVKDPRVIRIDKDWGWSSGPTATRIALEKKKFKKLYILGMDFFGLTPDGRIEEKKGSKINNMYAGTQRYRKKNSDRTYFGNWLNQMVQNTANHDNALFYHVVLENQRSPQRLEEKPNWIDITYEEFEHHLQKMPKKES